MVCLDQFLDLYNDSDTVRLTGTAESISDVLPWTGAREATWSVAAGSYSMTASIV